MPVGEYYQEYGPIRRRQRSLTSPDRPLRRMARRRSPLRPRERLPFGRRLWRFAVRSVLVLLATILLLPYGVSLLYTERALPGIRLQGRPIGNYSAEEIQRVIALQYGAFFRSPLQLTHGEQRWHLTLDDLGVRVDTASLIRTALTLGREGGPVTRLATLWELWRHGREVPLPLVVNWGTLQQRLLALSPEIEVPPRNASLSLSGGHILATPAAEGTQFLVDETITEILRALQHLKPQEVVIRTRPLAPVITNEALHGAVGRAQQFLTQPLTLTHSTGTWHWDAEMIAGLLRVEPAGRQIVVQVDQERLDRAVERLAQFVNTGTAEPRLRFEQGHLRMVEEGRSGWQLQPIETSRRIREVLHQDPTLTRTVALSVTMTFPRVTADMLDSLGIRELVGEGKSSFAGSEPYRITNIKAAAARLDGVLIAPGETFSFNTQIGEITAEHGFVEGYAVVGNRTQLEWGGGICQNSTTVFRAAFWAGLPIVERHPHPFYLSWYDRFAYGPQGDGPGMDATIFTGVNDLKFVNDTGHWLLMQTDVDEYQQMLTVQLYGTRPDRQVVLDGPYLSNEVQAPREPFYVNDPTRPAGSIYQSDVARNGRDITIYRSIVSREAEIRRDTFFTRFRAWPNIYVRGTGR